MKKLKIEANQTRSTKTRNEGIASGRKRHRPVLVSKVYASRYKEKARMNKEKYEETTAMA